MSGEKPRVVLVGGEKRRRWAVGSALLESGYSVEEAGGGDEAVRIASQNAPDLIILDFSSPDREAAEWLERIRAAAADVLVLILAGKEAWDAASEAAKLGGCHLIEKPIATERLVQMVKDLAADSEIRQEAKRIDPIVIGYRQNDRLILGRSRKMGEILRIVGRVSHSPNSTVLIEGESGTGKEMIAKAIHFQTEGRKGPFMEINCGSLPANLLESELFGHERGAFTGAVRQRRGRFELAHGGALFLDEIAEISPVVQVKLLRVLEEHEFERVGGEDTIRVSVRVIAATNRDLEGEVKKGTFRGDLFYRLFVIPIHLPPLRERREDIPLLTEHFIRKLSEQAHRAPVAVTAGALELLQRYAWPGNVRELENALERAIVLCDGDRIAEGDLAFLQARPSESIPLPGGVVPLNDAMARLERTLVERAMEQTGGVKTEAARLLGIKPSALYYKLEKHGLS